ncbi:MAG TPA: response regulator transcription factor [Ktedonobacteraceae bacterium]
MEQIQILIADDHPVFRDGLRVLLTSAAEMAVVGEATTGAETISMATMLQPDVILMDIRMPELNGIEATRQIVSNSPHIGILVLTMYEDDDSVFAAMRAGARGYLLKGADRDEILGAIRAVHMGGAIFSATIAQRLMHYFSTLEPTVPRAFPDLTDREREILTLLAQGYTNTTIAERLVLSPKTVRNNVSNIFSKLQVVDRAQAILRARDAGLGGERRT